jgi:hypothetical protein
MRDGEVSPGGGDRLVVVNLARQRLELHARGEVVFACSVSTAANGPGEVLNSECTPRGLHVIEEKIGAGSAPDTVFVGRRPTGEACTPALRATRPDRDWIVTRILWLGGLEPGRNRGGSVDTKARYIYIHGTPEHTPIGVPGSRGCVRMRNGDVMTLFDLVDVGTRVRIDEA